jgi:hypothetical protein
VIPSATRAAAAPLFCLTYRRHHRAQGDSPWEDRSSACAPKLFGARDHTIR